MCWPHVYRNVTPRLSQLRKINRNLADDLLTDIEFLQWSVHDNSFRIVFDLLERKYSDSATFSSPELSELKDFFLTLENNGVLTPMCLGMWFLSSYIFLNSFSHKLQVVRREAPLWS